MEPSAADTPRRLHGCPPGYRDGALLAGAIWLVIRGDSAARFADEGPVAPSRPPRRALASVENTVGSRAVCRQRCRLTRGVTCRGWRHVLSILSVSSDRVSYRGRLYEETSVEKLQDQWGMRDLPVLITIASFSGRGDLVSAGQIAEPGSATMMSSLLSESWNGPASSRRCSARAPVVQTFLAASPARLIRSLDCIRVGTRLRSSSSSCWPRRSRESPTLRGSRDSRHFCAPRRTWAARLWRTCWARYSPDWP